ncbi:MAG: glycosyl hydrolase family 28 protein [Verrucomicrobiota bacterium]
MIKIFIPLLTALLLGAPGQLNAAEETAFNPRVFGAAGDGKTKDTVAIQRAIDAAAKAGGTVLLDRGVFLSGTLHLKSGVTLRIQKGATLLGSAEHADYQKNRWLALIEARDAHDIAITGGGIVDGQGELLAADVVRLMKAGKLRDAPDSRRPSEQNRPQVIELVDCARVTVRDITVKNSACWVQTYINCVDLTLDRVTVRSTAYWNNDGMDIMDCRRVAVTHCDVDSADDGICLKSGDPKRVCENVRIEDCAVRSSASALKFGTSSRGGFKHITVRGLRIRDTFRSAIAIESVDGAVIEDVDIADVQAKNTGNAIFIRLGHRNQDGQPGSIRKVRIQDVSVEIPATAPDAGYPFAGPPVRAPHNIFPSSIVGLPGHLISDITLKNIVINTAGGARREVAEVPLEKLSLVPEQADRYPEFSMFGELPAWGFYVRHGQNIVFENVDFHAVAADFRPALVFDDVQSPALNAVRITPTGGLPAIVTRNVREMKIQPSQSPEAKLLVREISSGVDQRNPMGK